MPDGSQQPSHGLPLVSVVVVTFNNATILHACLDGLQRQDYPTLEIIVVDNGSTEDIGGMLRRDFPAFRLIRLENNTGFAGFVDLVTMMPFMFNGSQQVELSSLPAPLNPHEYFSTTWKTTLPASLHRSMTRSSSLRARYFCRCARWRWNLLNHGALL